ncbi:MAG: LD-carboxypeptidase [Alphaproteobacteria bacterium]|nr:LD-carboxypeptidase [Alphaproteobacteria bacterium]MDE2495430.1 LD-carboxypeptidase [Alphaproteobacteria bacterium]
MRDGRMRIGVVAPASRLEPVFAEKVLEVARTLLADRAPDIQFHPQCFLSWGHFAGGDDARAQAFLDVANDPEVDALWIGRGGYGSCRIAERVIAGLTDAAKQKIYLGYSDAGALLGSLYAHGIGNLAHGPMPADVNRQGGEKAVGRALSFLLDRAADTLEPNVSPATMSAAFNMTVLSQVIGTPLQPDLTDHVLMLEEVSEYMYRIDRTMFHLTGNAGIRKVAGIRLGRCSEIPPNDPDFGQGEEEVVEHWCATSGIAYLGRADIGHDIDNKIVPFGRLRNL